jgi:hypothetical protein
LGEDGLRNVVLEPRISFRGTEKEATRHYHLLTDRSDAGEHDFAHVTFDVVFLESKISNPHHFEPKTPYLGIP